MPPERGRASLACIACRKQKTRCYETSPNQACLRCERLGQPCSLVQEHADHMSTEAWPNNVIAPPGEDQLARFERLEQTINVLTQRVNILEAARSSSNSQAVVHDYPTPAISEHQSVYNQNATGYNEARHAPPFPLHDTNAEMEYETVAEVDAQRFARGSEEGSTSTKGLVEDSTTAETLTTQEALNLLSHFQMHIGRWIIFDKTVPTVSLLEDVRKHSLLLTCCCLVAARHASSDTVSELAPTLFTQVTKLLSVALLSTPQPFAFFQSALILSMWSTTIAQAPLKIDSWLLSGIALQHSTATALFTPAAINNGSGCSKAGLDRMCVWNHICLVHLHYCVGTRRKAVISRTDINQCRQILGSDHANTFETGLVAEIYLYWVLYETLNAPVDLARTQTALQAWKSEWQYVIDRSNSHLLKMSFYFAQILTYDQSLKARSSAARESLISEMIRLSAGIIKLTLETADERTKYLPDHTYHIISFAAVTLSRLLHTYEPQLAMSHDIPGLERLIMSLVSCLHAIGSSSHISYAMASVIGAFHQKLRRNSVLSPTTSCEVVDTAIYDEFAQSFPELFGARPFLVGSVQMLPDFQPIS